MKKFLFALLLGAAGLTAFPALADGMPEWTLYQRDGAIVLHTESALPQGDALIEITDVLGKRVATYRRSVSNIQQDLEIATQLTPGVYMVKIQVGADIQVRRLRWQ
jgi:hypothetical protein